MSLELNVDLGGIYRLQQRIQRLGQIDKSGLLDAIGFEVENQTKRRIQHEKSSPDGTPWPAWSAKYAETRHGGQSLLMASGDSGLLGSIQNHVQGEIIEVGSNLDYAAIQNLGGTAGMPPGPAAIPSREYLGLSGENIDDIAAVIDDFLDQHIKEALA